MRLTLLCCMLLLAATVFSQSKKQQKFEAIERQRFVAMTKKDTAALHLILADDLTYVHSNGLIEDKAKHIANIVSGKIVYSTMEPTEINVRVHGRTAYINGIVQVAGSFQEKPFNIRLRYIDVYTKKRGKWRLSAWQSLKLD